MPKPIVALLVNHNSAKRVLGEENVKRLKSFARLQVVDAAHIDSEILKKSIRGADGVMTSWGTPALTAEFLDLAPKLKIVAHAAGSIKPIVSDEIWKRKITVTSAASAIAFSVAEYTLGSLILGLRRLQANVAHVREGKWGSDHEAVRMLSLDYAVIGLVGAGFVGRRVVEVLRPHCPNLLMFDPILSKADAKKLGVKKATLAEIAAKADAVTLHAPDLPATYRMIDRKFIFAMKPNALLVNSARGKLIEETALIERLKRGDLSAILDVTDPEPPAKDNPLRSLANVILTPHVAGSGAYQRVGKFAVTELEQVLKGKKPTYAVTKEMLKHMA
ncbi:MAG: hydroxyacid dehydrogenase [Spirochaetia bacterium]|nr:hydroxyacid dehydrogenase [Spirochaetia bacterium]